MQCPKCEHDMETLDYEDVEVDRCTNCRGIWFDVGESHALHDPEAANALDTGDPHRGREKNRISRYRCPRCGGGMMRMTDPMRPEVCFEECTACRGSFFDAGEFVELTTENVAEVLARARK